MQKAVITIISSLRHSLFHKIFLSSLCFSSAPNPLAVVYRCLHSWWNQGLTNLETQYTSDLQSFNLIKFNLVSKFFDSTSQWKIVRSRTWSIQQLSNLPIMKTTVNIICKYLVNSQILSYSDSKFPKFIPTSRESFISQDWEKF